MVAGMFNDEAAPHDDVASLYSLGPATQCPNVEWALRRAMLVCAAYQAVRAHRRDHRVSTKGGRSQDRQALGCARLRGSAPLLARWRWPRCGRVRPAAISPTCRRASARPSDEATSECARDRLEREREINNIFRNHIGTCHGRSPYERNLALQLSSSSFRFSLCSCVLARSGRSAEDGAGACVPDGVGDAGVRRQAAGLSGRRGTDGLSMPCGTDGLSGRGGMDGSDRCVEGAAPGEE